MRRLALTATVLAGTLGVAAHAASFLPFLADDALISLHYAQRLLDGNGLTFTDGPRVEGYTNLLHVLLVAGFGLFGLDLVAAARFVCLLGAGGAVLAAAGWFHRRGSARHAGAIVAAATVVVFAPVAVWVSGALEQAVLAGLVGAGLVLVLRIADGGRIRPWMVGGLFAAAALTRPDTVMFAVLAGIAALLSGRTGRVHRALAVLGPVVAAVLAQLAFRLAYYGDVLPNTFYVKFAPTSSRFADGLDYVASAVADLWPVYLLAGAGLARLVCADRRAAALFTAAVVITHGYAAVLGGDVFYGWRHLVVATVPLAVLCGEAVDAAVSQLRRVRAVPAAAAIVAAAAAGTVVVGAMLAAQSQQGELQRARAELWVHDCAVLARDLGAAYHDTAPQPVLAVVTAGCMPFYAQLPALDMLGLNDRRIARRDLPDTLVGPVGHDRGDPDYVLAQRPDLVIPAVGPTTRGTFFADRVLTGMPAFVAAYTPLTVAVDGPRGRVLYPVWVLRASPSAGIRSESVVRIPGSLFGRPLDETLASAPWVASFDGGVPAATPVHDGAVARFTLELAPGTYQLDSDHSGDVTVDVAGSTRFTHDGGDVELTATGSAGSRLLEVRIEPVDRN